jgi:hypothetical protein
MILQEKEQAGVVDLRGVAIIRIIRETTALMEFVLDDFIRIKNAAFTPGLGDEEKNEDEERAL